jgi:hypothetical protein
MHVATRTDHRTVAEERAPAEHRPGALWPLLAFMGLLSLGGFVGGASFIADPTGAGVGAKLSWLDETPVHDFLLPGVFLLGVYGVGTLILMAGLIWRFSPGRIWRFSPGRIRRLDGWLGHHWSWAGTLLVGVILIAWIVYEFTIFPETIALQPILIGVGMLMIAIPLLPSMRRYSTTRRER